MISTVNSIQVITQNDTYAELDTSLKFSSFEINLRWPCLVSLIAFLITKTDLLGFRRLPDILPVALVRGTDSMFPSVSRQSGLQWQRLVSASRLCMHSSINVQLHTGLFLWLNITLYCKYRSRKENVEEYISLL